jgi:hypothetical protein
LIAEMSVALGLPPSEVERVGEENPDLLAAMKQALDDRWTTETEPPAGLYELAHNTNRPLPAPGGAKDIPDPVKVPRPGRHQTPERRTVATSAEFAAWHAARRGGR